MSRIIASQPMYTYAPIGPSDQELSCLASAPTSAQDVGDASALGQDGFDSLDSASNPGQPPTRSPIVLPNAPNRPPGTTEIEGIVTVNKYAGMQHGRNGDHEIVDGTLTTTNAVAKPGVVDTQNVQVAMNVASSKDPSGLPNEIPVKPGDQIEVEGEYIPASKANLNLPNGPAAVIHFTHNPLGYAIIDGQKYA